MKQANLLELAKQGNVKAITVLINRCVQPKGVAVVKAAFNDSCLQIMLESATVPNQQALVAFVRKGITGLGIASIKKVIVHGRQTGKKVSAWSQEFELAGQPLMVMSQPKLLELAKQGNAKSIAALMNSSVQPKGISVVKAVFNDNCLQIILESATVPNQQALVAFVRDRLTGLGIPSIKKVIVYGRQTGKKVSAWSQKFELAGQPLPMLVPQPNLLELAQQGNIKAIATLMNRALQPKGISVVKAAFKDNCLKIVLESATVPNQQALVAFVRKGIIGLGATPIERVKLYGRQAGKDFPAWSQEFLKDSDDRLSTNNNTLLEPQLETNYVNQKSQWVNMSAKPFVLSAHRKFWQFPSLLRFGVIGLILSVVGLNIFVISNSNDSASPNANNFSSYNLDEQYKYILNDFIKHQVKNDEDLVESMKIFNKQGGFEASKKRAMKNCKALNEGVLKENLIQNKTQEVKNFHTFY